MNLVANTTGLLGRTYVILTKKGEIISEISMILVKPSKMNNGGLLGPLIPYEALLCWQNIVTKITLSPFTTTWTEGNSQAWKAICDIKEEMEFNINCVEHRERRDLLLVC